MDGDTEYCFFELQQHFDLMLGKVYLFKIKACFESDKISYFQICFSGIAPKQAEHVESL